MRFDDAKNMNKAKEFMSASYPGAWAIVARKTFDQGIVHVGRHAEEEGESQ